jgi:signal peptidase II
LDKLKKTTWLILIVAVLVIAIDQLGKYLVVAALPVGGVWSPFPDDYPVFQLVHVTNTGVAFGLFKDLGLVSIGIALVVTGVIIIYSRQVRNDQWLTCVSLGLMLGGALGNVIDRIRLGHVIDFIDVGIGTTRWYTSNLADVMIGSGVILLGLATVLDERKHKRDTASERIPANGHAETSGAAE